MSVTVEGEERIIRKLNATAKLGDDSRLLVPVAELLAAELRSVAPRGSTGGLAESIDVEVEKKKITVGPDKTGFYGFFLEYGTSKMSARPWFRPAVDRAMRPATVMTRRQFSNAIERVWR